MSTLLPLQEACRLLAIDTSTLYRWCQRAGIALQQDNHDKRRRMIALTAVQRLAELHGISLATEDVTQEKQEPSPDEILHRLDTINQRLTALEHQIVNLHTELRLILDVLQHPQSPQPAQPRQLSPTSKQPTLAPSHEQKEVSAFARGKRQPVPGNLPEGTIHVLDFASEHKVNRRTLLAHIVEHTLDHVALPSSRAGESKRYLTPTQQRGVVAFWQSNGTPYQECPGCPHE